MPNTVLSSLESEVLPWVSWMWNNTHPHASSICTLNTSLSLLIATLLALGAALLELRKWQGNHHQDMEFKGLTPPNSSACFSTGTNNIVHSVSTFCVLELVQVMQMKNGGSKERLFGWHMIAQ